MSGLHLPEGPKELHCAAPGCPSVGSPAPRPLLDGAPLPPEGWGEVEVWLDDGSAFVVFACSRACQRRLAASPPALRSIDTPKPTTPWRP